MTNYNDGKWHGWNGGECPVQPNTVVDVLFANGRKGSSKVEAKYFRWSRIYSGADIVAFNVVKEHREPRECWAYLTHMFDSIEGAAAFRAQVDAANPGRGYLDTPITHWREVVE